MYGSRFIQHVVLPCFTSKNEVLIIPNQLNFETWHHQFLRQVSPTSSSFCRSSSACRSRSWLVPWRPLNTWTSCEYERGFIISGKVQMEQVPYRLWEKKCHGQETRTRNFWEVRVPLLLPSLLLAGAKTRTSKRILPRLLVFSFVTIVNTLFKLHSAAAPPNYSLCIRCTRLTQRSLTPWVMTCANQMVRMQHLLSSWTAFIGPLWEDEFSILGTYVRSIWNILGPSFEAIETDHTSSNSNLHMVINQVGVLRS